MHLSDIIRFYSNEDVQDHIIALARSREVIARFNTYVGKRPDSLIYKNDIIELAKKGATSFHASMERWKNPFLLRQDIKKKEMDDIRIGWDLIIDIDSPHLEYTKICADILCEALEFHNIKNYSVKFSGNTGFHIGVPFESFPNEINGQETRLLFPEGARIIAAYLADMIKKQLTEDILKFEDIKSILKRTGKKFDEIVVNGELEPYKLLNIDSVAISPRHLFRMPYSFNEKSWLVSVPIHKKDILSFKKEYAKYENVKPELGFLDKFKKDEAKQLFLQAFDWNMGQEVQKEIKELSEKYEIPTTAVPEEYFPPCIKNLYKGLEDGRKRALFILLNFLKSAGWDSESIKKEVYRWNKTNPEPLRESYVNAQIAWTAKLKNTYLPPACKNPNYYKDLGICSPDNICTGNTSNIIIKNPIVYPFRKMKKFKRVKK